MTTTRDEVHGDPLADAVAQLRLEAIALRSDIQALRRRNRALWSLLVVIVAVGGLVMWDSRHEIAENNRRWCPVARAISARPGDPPPAGDAEQRARAQAIRDFFTESARDWC